MPGPASIISSSATSGYTGRNYHLVIVSSVVEGSATWGALTTPARFGTPLSFNSYLSQKPGWVIAQCVYVNLGGNTAIEESDGVNGSFRPSEDNADPEGAERNITGSGHHGHHPMGGNGEAKGSTGGGGPFMHHFTKHGSGYAPQAVIVFDAPQDDDTDDDDGELTLDNYLGNPFPWEQQARLTAERQNFTQNWVMSLYET
ncbi:hypothetical protein K440DRAFT_636779 [Wilcoxina mikolae CBS 423.85]|nr:hypothetical protein K440DRAFT_636779 [Wilcoxina mikolae CBS 423.85]